MNRIESEPYMGRNLSCFYAEWDILPGENIVLKVEEALRESRFIGLVMSPDWEKSDWTTLERVIPVYDDPAGYKGRVLPILRRSCSIPPSIIILKWFNFQSENNFEREARKLVARLKGESLRPPRSSSPTAPRHPGASENAASPDFQVETLASNLFPVVRMPARLFASNSTVAKRSDIWAEIGSGADVPPFAFQESSRKLYTFGDLRNSSNELKAVTVESTTEELSTLSALRNSPALVIDILNRSMTAHMRGLGMNYDWNNKKTFFPLERERHENRRSMTWKVGAREWRRTLVRPAGSVPVYYAHRSCKATFTNSREHLYLKLLPGWHFTVDGFQTPIAPELLTSLSSHWMNRERNHSLLEDTRFWIYVLSGGKESVSLFVGGESRTEILSSPLFATIGRGIEGDYRERLWYEGEPQPDEMMDTEKEEANV